MFAGVLTVRVGDQVKGRPVHEREHAVCPRGTIAFEATDLLRRDASAIVHVDNTARVQLVHREVLPLYHRLLRAFERRTGAPVILNTSFNVKGEPIVRTFLDALRTFFSTGLDVLVAGHFLIRKQTGGTTV